MIKITYECKCEACACLIYTQTYHWKPAPFYPMPVPDIPSTVLGLLVCKDCQHKVEEAVADVFNPKPKEK